MGQMKEFAGIYYREGALDPKTMQLVALAAMAAAVVAGGMPSSPSLAATTASAAMTATFITPTATRRIIRPQQHPTHVAP